MLDGERVLIRGKDGKDYVAIKPAGEEVAATLINKGVDVRAEPQEQSGIFSLISLWLPFLVLIGIWIFFMNRMQGGGRGGAMALHSRARQAADREHGRVTFDDVAGIDEAKEDWKKSSNSCATRRNSAALAARSRRARSGRPARHG